jgi:polyhydroxyalkanoate synthesis regulator phasin
MVFEGLTQKDLRNDPRYQRFLNSAPLRQMYYDIGQGKAEKYRQIIKQRSEKGLNGNAAIGTRFDETAMSEDGKPGAYKAGTDKDNQNIAVTNAMLQLVDEAEDIYKTYGLIMSNPDLLKAVLGNEVIKQRIQELGINEHEYLLSGILVPNASEADYIVDAILDAKYSEDGETTSADSPTLEKILAENVLNDVNSLREEILYLEKKIRDEYAKLPAEKQTLEGRKELERESSYLKGLIEDRDALVEQFEEIVQGKHSDHFLNQTLFMLQGSPLKYWDNLGGSITDEGGSTKNITAFAKFNYGVANFDSLEEGDLKRLIRERYDDYLTMRHARLRKIAEMNLTLSETLNPVFTKLTERLKDAKEHESYLYGSKRMMIGEVVNNLQTEVETLEQQLQQLTDQGKAGDPEAVEIINKIQKINASLEAYHALPLEMSFEE